MGSRYGKLRRSIKNGILCNLIMFMFLIITMLLYHAPAQATESGGSRYPGGNEDFMAGALPPPGMYPISYFLYYNLDKLKDDKGHDVPIGFDADVYVYCFRFVHVTHQKLLGADWAWHIVVPLVHQSVKMDKLGIDEDSSGIGDIEFSPLILGWHFNKNMHLIGALSTFMPTGDYDENDPSSIGRHYWTIAPILAPTYLSDSGFEISAKFQYFINTKNNDTDYTSGNELLCDYLVGQHIGNWSIGLNGFIYKQITNDRQRGHDIHDYKGQSISYGPAIQYNYKNMFFNVKYQWESEVENKPEGEKLWFKFLYAF